jgi:hypothetical protein
MYIEFPKYFSQPNQSQGLKGFGQAGSKGMAQLFLVSNKTWTPPVDSSDTLKTINNGLELRKLQPPKVEVVRNSKEQTNKPYKTTSQNKQKISCVFLYCYQSSKMICKTQGDSPKEL